MGTLIARNDAVIVAQVATLTPVAANTTVYTVSINGKTIASITSDGSATVQEIVEALEPLLTASEVTEALEATYTENNSLITATGLSTGKPFTLASTGAGTLTYAVTTAAKSPNHWIAENFDTGALPIAADDVIIANLLASQSFKYGLDHNTVTLASLKIMASSQAEIGLPDYNTDSDRYYQTTYRDTHLKISATLLTIGEGIGPGAKRIKLNLGTNACSATIVQTCSTRPSPSEAPVHLIGAHASNAIQVISGAVDIGMLPGTGASCNWPTAIASGGYLRFGEGASLTTIEAAGSSTIETRSAVTTMRTRDNGKVLHFGSGGITTLDIAGGKVEVQATGVLTIATLNGYAGKELDLTKCDSAVTITNATIYGNPTNPFVIRDPNNKLTMTNPFSCPNGAASLVVVTGSGKTVKVV